MPWSQIFCGWWVRTVTTQNHIKTCDDLVFEGNPDLRGYIITSPCDHSLAPQWSRSSQHVATAQRCWPSVPGARPTAAAAAQSGPDEAGGLGWGLGLGWGNHKRKTWVKTWAKPYTVPIFTLIFLKHPPPQKKKKHSGFRKWCINQWKNIFIQKHRLSKSKIGLENEWIMSAG